MFSMLIHNSFANVPAFPHLSIVVVQEVAEEGGKLIFYLILLIIS